MTSTSIPACRASTSGACRRCRSPTSRCSTSQSPSLSRVQVAFKRAFDVAVVAGACWSCCRRCCVAIAVAVKLDRPRPGAVPPAPRRSRRRRVRDPQVPLDVRRRRGPPGGAARRAQRAHADRCSSWTRDPRVTRDRALHPGVQPRRAAAAAERAARRDEPRRPAPGAAVGGRRVPGRPPRPPPRAARHHGPVAGRGAGQPVVRAPTAGSTCSTSTTGRCCSTSSSCSARSSRSWSGRSCRGSRPADEPVPAISAAA